MAEFDDPGRERLRRLAGDAPGAKTYEPGRTSAVAPAPAHAGGTVGKRTLAESWGAGVEAPQVNPAVCAASIDLARRHLATLTAVHAPADQDAATATVHELRLALDRAHAAAGVDQRATVDALAAEAAPLLAAVAPRRAEIDGTFYGEGRDLLAADVAAYRASRDHAPDAAELGMAAARHIADVAAAHGAREQRPAIDAHTAAATPSRAPTDGTFYGEGRDLWAGDVAADSAARDQAPNAAQLAEAAVRRIADGAAPHGARKQSRAADARGAASMPSRAPIDGTFYGHGRDMWAGDVAAARASREQAWTAAAAPIAAQLGVDAAIRVDDAAATHGARGLAHAGVVHLVPTLAPEHGDALHVLAHELVHVAQSRLPQAGSLADAEHEADTLAAALVRGSLPHRPRVGLAAGVAAADTGAKDAKHAPQETAPDLGGAPFQLIAGTFDFWIDRAWYGAAPDRQVDGGLWISPSCNLELFAALQQRGELSWVGKAELADAAREIGIGAPGAETATVFRMRMTVGAFDAFGLGPSANPVAAPLPDGGFDVVIAIPDVHGAPHREFMLSVAHKDAILAAIETPTKLTVLPAPRAQFLAQTFHATLGNGTTHVVLDGAYCRALFGAAYDKWLVRQASGDPTSTIRPIGMADPALAPDEVAFVRAWLARNLTASADAAAPVLDRRLYTALQALEDLPADQRALVAHLLAEQTKAQPVSASLLEQLLFEADRAHAGFAEHAANPDARPPTFDYPIPARLDQTSDRVVDGEAVKLRLLIAWPEAATEDQASDYHWRTEVADIDWLFVCNAEEGKEPLELRESSRVHGDGTGIEHRFTVPGHLESAIWKVTAFVRHNLFQPAQLYTEIEVRRVDVAMTELRAKAFTGLGTATAVEDHHDFFPDDFFDGGSYDTGILLRGDLPADFTHRNAAELAANVDREIAQTEVLLRHLVDQHLASAAIDASRAHLARLHEIKDAIVEVGQTTVRPFELRGTYLGIGNQLADGALDLIGTTWFGGKLDGTAETHVEIFDLSRRFDTKTSTFSGAGATFEIAVEAAFLQLCKAYPGGRLAVLAESVDSHFQTTGKTIGFELDTGTIGKDVKAKVFDPIVNKVVNIGLSAIMVVFPETAPVLMTVLVAYNESQNVDAALSEYARGALTPGRKVLHLAQFALDVMPLARQAKVFDVGGKLVSVFEHGGVVLLMGVQAQDQIAEIRDTQVAEAAKLYAELVTLQASTHGSDPRIQAKQAELEARITTIQDATLDVMKESLVDYGTVALPGHLVSPLHEALGRRQFAAMETRGEFIHEADVAPHYDSARDAIVGDRTQATAPVVEALVRQQKAVRAAKPAPEPIVHATPEEQAFLDANARHDDPAVRRPQGVETAPASDPKMEDWERAATQATAVDATKAGTATSAQREHLADEVRRQIPDIALVEAVRAGEAQTVISIVSPGGGETGIKHMNDDLIGYALNSTYLIPERNRVIKAAFEEEGLKVVDQAYKTTTVVSGKTVGELGAAMQRGLVHIDAAMKPILETALTKGIAVWTRELEGLASADKKAIEAKARIGAMRELLATIRGRADFQFDVHLGAAALEGGRDASYGAILASEMDSTKAAIMARDASIAGTPEISDRRALVYSPEQFVRVCEEAVAIHDELRERTLPYHGERTQVLLSDGTLDRDILRDVRKGKYKEALTAADRETLALVDTYFKRVNTFDYIKHFTGAETLAQGERVARATELVRALEGTGALGADMAAEIESLLRGAIPQAGAASEAQFYNRAAAVKNRTVINADIKDLGLKLFDGYAKQVGEVGQHQTMDLTTASQTASDDVVKYKRRAAQAFANFYTEQLIPEARSRAEARHRPDLLAAIDREAKPLMLLGGDELTVSLDPLFDELGLVPEAIAKITDPGVANARVSVTHTDAGTDGARGHAEAMAKAQTGQDILKKTYEPLARRLEDKARKLPGAAGGRALALAEYLQRIYVTDDHDGLAFHDASGAVIDIAEKERAAEQLLQESE